MLTAQDLLRMKYNKNLQDLYGQQRDYGEQIKTRYAMTPGMEGGFGTSEENRMNREALAQKTDIMAGYKLESDYLAEIEKKNKEAKKAGMISRVLTGGLLGTVLEKVSPDAAKVWGLAGKTALAFVPGGSAISATADALGNTIAGTGEEPPNLDFSFLSDWQNYRARRSPKKVKGTQAKYSYGQDSLPSYGTDYSAYDPTVGGFNP